MKQLVAIIVTTCLLFGLVACEAPHKHTFSNEWSYDDAFHFHKATCGDTDEVKDKEPHVIKDGKCEICDYKQKAEKPETEDPKTDNPETDNPETDDPETEGPKQIDSGVLSTATETATEQQKDRAVALLTAFGRQSGFGGFTDGDLYCKDHTAEGTSAQNSEYKIDGFKGGFSDLEGIKVTLTRIIPTYSGTQKLYYYADDDCAVEDFGSEQNCYEATGTVSSLIEELISDIASQINYAGTLIMLPDCKIGYLMDDFELVSLEYKSGSTDKSSYVFAFSDGAVAGIKINRSYQTANTGAAKQFELLIGNYKVQKPDTTGFKTVSYRPKWAAGYPSGDVFDREFTLVTASEKSRVNKLLTGTAEKLSRRDNTVILADGDINFMYKSTATSNEVTFDKNGVAMKVHEKSLIFESDVAQNTAVSAVAPIYTDDSHLKPVPSLPDKKEDQLVEIEHYAELGICYETIKGNTTAFIGDYTNQFYAMMHHTLINLCDFINQYFQAPSSGAYEVYINDDEFTSIKLVVPDCGYMIYVYDSEGKLLGIKIEINNTLSTLLVGKFDVTIPVYDNYTTSAGVPYTSYLG